MKINKFIWQLAVCILAPGLHVRQPYIYGNKSNDIDYVAGYIGSFCFHFILKG